MSLREVADSAMKIGPLTVFQHRAALTTMQGDCTMAIRDLPSPELLRKLLNYNPETGVLTWRERQSSRTPAGSIAGCRAVRGYRKLIIRGRSYQAHRVIWALHTGAWPSGIIDHLNGDTSDNRIQNLRDVTQGDNMRNMRMKVSNTSGANGVTFHKGRGKWQAFISAEKKFKYLGSFSDFDKAVAARRAAEIELGYTSRHGKKMSGAQDHDQG